MSFQRLLSFMCLITLGGPSNLPYIYSKLLNRDNLPHFSGFIIQINEQQTMPYKIIPLHHSKTHTNSNCNFCPKVGFEKLLLRIIPKSIKKCFVLLFCYTFLQSNRQTSCYWQTKYSKLVLAIIALFNPSAILI